MTSGKRRSDLAITNEILSLCKLNPQTSTDIYYKVRLGFNMVKKYYNLLVASGLLKEGIKKVNVRNTKSFICTEKGREFMEYYNRLSNLILKEEKI